MHSYRPKNPTTQGTRVSMASKMTNSTAEYSSTRPTTQDHVLPMRSQSSLTRPGWGGGIWCRDTRIRRGSCAAFAEAGTTCRLAIQSKLDAGPSHAQPDLLPWEDNRNQIKGTGEAQGPQHLKRLNAALRVVTRSVGIYSTSGMSRGGLYTMLVEVTSAEEPLPL